MLYLACTRPALKAGVPFEALVCNAFGTLVLGMILGSPLYWALGFLLHIPMRILTEYDHNYFRLGRLWLETKGRASTRILWGGSSLSPMPSGLPRDASDLSSAV